MNEIGLKQAQAAGKALKNVSFHQAYSSDLKRANKTCQIILEENQASSSINVENIKQDKQLRERHFGICEGQSYLEFNAAKEINGEDFHPENGESIGTIRDRARQILKTIAKQIE